MILIFILFYVTYLYPQCLVSTYYIIPIATSTVLLILGPHYHLLDTSSRPQLHLLRFSITLWTSNTSVSFLWFKTFSDSEYRLIVSPSHDQAPLLFEFKPRHLVNKSALCSIVPILLISISLVYMLYRNQWYVIPMCLVLDNMRGPLLLARFCVPILSSHALETDPTPFKSRLVFFRSSRTRFLADTSSLIHWDNSISASKVERAISVCNFEIQKIETPPKLMITPVLLLTEMGSLLSSTTNSTAKSASVKNTTEAVMILEIGLNLCFLFPLNI